MADKTSTQFAFDLPHLRQNTLGRFLRSIKDEPTRLHLSGHISGLEFLRDEMKAVLHGYACSDLCDAPKLADGRCAFEAVGQCGAPARDILNGVKVN